MEGRSLSNCPENQPAAKRRQERRRPDLTHTESHGGGPSSPFAGPAVKLSAVRGDVSILTPRSGNVFYG